MADELTLPENTKVPNHLAIIPDGNRRWAREKGLPAIEGHRRGAQAGNKIIRAARDFGIHTMTLWGFSTENWKRSEEERKHLMRIFEKAIDDNLEQAKEDQAKIFHLGRKDKLPKSLLKKLKTAVKETKENTKHVFNIALDYGGQDEILRAVKKALEDIKEGKITVEKLFEKVGKWQGKYPYFYFKNYLDTSDQPYPYPDFVIRTSGEKRLSGLMPWQCAYSELYFEPSYFPAFTPEKLRDAIIDYSNRNRRFGGN